MQLDPQLTESLTPERITAGMTWLAVGAVVGACAAVIARFVLSLVAALCRRFKLVDKEQQESWAKNGDPLMVKYVMVLGAVFCGLLLSHFQSLLAAGYLLWGASTFLFVNMLIA